MTIKDCKSVVLGWEDLALHARNILDNNSTKNEISTIAKSNSNYSANARKVIAECDFAVFKFLEHYVPIKTKWQ